MFDLIGSLGSLIINGITGHFERKQQLAQAIVENKIRLAQSEQSHNEDWEMKCLENQGWKDDVLFYAIVLMFVWSGFDPERAKTVFDNWSLLPDWFVQLVTVVVGSVLGIRKIADYCPAMVRGIKTAWTGVTQQPLPPDAKLIDTSKGLPWLENAEGKLKDAVSQIIETSDPDRAGGA